MFRIKSVHALSSETGRLIREDEKLPPLQAWGDVTIYQYHRLPFSGKRHVRLYYNRGKIFSIAKNERDTMFVRMHGFDWMVYSERVMPAFTSWLMSGDDSMVHQLYKETRSGRGEQYVPAAVRHLCVWPRAQEFVKQLPRGPQALHEYQNLCAAELFTALSDKYVRLYPPRLYQDSEALRTVWGAIVEQFCLPWFHLSLSQAEATPPPQIQKKQESPFPTEEAGETDKNELISLLKSAGLDDLAHHVGKQLNPKSSVEPEEDRIIPNETDGSYEDGDEDIGDAPRGIIIGRQPASLHMRGWLATISVRTMVLFEFLACGRRCMPFGYHAGEPFEGYIGYLTPDEIWQMALLLGDVEPPDPIKAQEDARNFHDQLSTEWDESRLIDEILPEHAMEFLQAIHNAAHQGLGLICSIG